MSDYGEDLAHIHHHGFAEFAESASVGLLEILWRHGIREGLVVDAGCGSGVLARELSQAGFSVFGFDASPAMIELARETAPAAQFEVATFADAALPPCNAIVAMGEVLNYGTLADARAFFANASRALRPGGVLVFDIAERGAYPAHDERRVDGEDWAVIAIKDSDGARLTRRVLTFRNLGGDVRRSEEVHTLELYERAEIVGLLRENGFRVRVRRSYGSRRLPKGHGVYFATR